MSRWIILLLCANSTAMQSCLVMSTIWAIGNGISLTTWSRFNPEMILIGKITNGNSVSTFLVEYIYLPNPWIMRKCNIRLIFPQSSASLNKGFSFFKASCHTKAKVFSLPYYLKMTGDKGSKDGFMPFQRSLVWNEMQTALSRSWIWLVESTC